MDDISFGEVEEQRPERALRPDRNRHFAVVECGERRPGELAVYVDIDVLFDMEEHALADTSVELGGVMLGGQFEDEEGNPFVVVTDSLRAEHYEATKGSFKFTHETWQQISRERDEFPAELQMVGWYHTHPDWGVFLSGMDTFICDHFFNKPLDVALVIDPCRQDRGWFQWRLGRERSLHRVGGFYVTASRYRQQELEERIAWLEQGIPMRTVTSSGPAAAPIVNIHEERSSWIGPAVLGTLAMQVVLIGLLAYALLRPQIGADDVAALIKDKERLQKEVDRRRHIDEKIELLETIVPDLRQGPRGVLDQLAETRSRAERLEVAADSAVLLKKERDGLTKQNQDLIKRWKALDADLKTRTAERDELKEAAAKLAKQGDAAPPDAAALWNNPYLLAAFVAAGVLLVGVLAALTMQKPEARERRDDPPRDGRETREPREARESRDAREPSELPRLNPQPDRNE